MCKRFCWLVCAQGIHRLDTYLMHDCLLDLGLPVKGIEKNIVTNTNHHKNYIYNEILKCPFEIIFMDEMSLMGPSFTVILCT